MTVWVWVGEAGSGGPSQAVNLHERTRADSSAASPDTTSLIPSSRWARDFPVRGRRPEQGGEPLRVQVQGQPRREPGHLPRRLPQLPPLQGRGPRGPGYNRLYTL